MSIIKTVGDLRKKLDKFSDNCKISTEGLNIPVTITSVKKVSIKVFDDKSDEFMKKKSCKSKENVVLICSSFN